MHIRALRFAGFQVCSLLSDRHLLFGSKIDSLSTQQLTQLHRLEVLHGTVTSLQNQASGMQQQLSGQATNLQQMWQDLAAARRSWEGTAAELAATSTDVRAHTSAQVGWAANAQRMWQELGAAQRSLESMRAEVTTSMAEVRAIAATSAAVQQQQTELGQTTHGSIQALQTMIEDEKAARQELQQQLEACLKTMATMQQEMKNVKKHAPQQTQKQANRLMPPEPPQKASSRRQRRALLKKVRKGATSPGFASGSKTAM